MQTNFMRSHLKLAVCDADAFYPFRSLVDGPLTKPELIEKIEEFLRAVVLHDEIAMDLQPHAYNPETDEEWDDGEIAAGGRNVIVAFGPVTEKYGLFDEDYCKNSIPRPELPPDLLPLISHYSNAGEGNVYYKAHAEYLQRLFGVVAQGGSVLCEGAFGRAAIDKVTEFPTWLFEPIDTDWKEYATRIHAGRFGLVIPPVLAIVLNRCARRDAIPAVLRDLRLEWADARRKVWDLVDQLKGARTVAEIHEIETELTEASAYFSPSKAGRGSSPLRVLWDLFSAALGGAAVAAISGGDPKVGAVTKLGAQAVEFATAQDARNLFRRGAFDLARRVSHEAASVEATPDLLSRFLTKPEIEALGYERSS
jgi:hypothetical protein